MAPQPIRCLWSWDNKHLKKPHKKTTTKNHIYLHKLSIRKEMTNIALDQPAAGFSLLTVLKGSKAVYTCIYFTLLNSTAPWKAKGQMGE